MTNLQEEHAVLQERFAELEQQYAKAQKRNAELEALVARKPEDVEMIRFHSGTGVKFKRGPETGGQWMPFCPSCPSPLGGETNAKGEPFAYCIARCGAHVIDLPTDFQSFIDEFNRNNVA